MVRADSKPLLSLLILAAIVFVAAGLRLYRIDTVPPGLWFDEALNVADARAVAQGGGLKLVYADVFPREPMFVTILAGVARWIATDYVTYRYASVLIGLLTVVSLYFALRAWTDERTALIAAALLAILPWHAILSRLLFRSILLPLWMCWIVWAAERAKEKPGIAVSVTLGTLIGGGFYTYLSWYFMLPGILALLVYLYGPFGGKGSDSNKKIGGVACAIAAVVVALPLMIDYARFPDHLLSRPSAVSPFANAEGGSAIVVIATNFRDALGMFHFRGDTIPKFNIPGKPALNPILGIFFAIGLGGCASGAWRRSAGHCILLGWLVLGILPTVFSQTDSPHYLRTLVATPAMAGITAVGIAAPWRWMEAKYRDRAIRFVYPGAVLILMGVSLYWTSRDIFVRWAPSQEVWETFNSGQTQIGRSAAATPEGVTYWIPSYIRDHRSLRYIAPEDPKIRSYSNFSFLRADEDLEGPRRVVVTNHNNLYPLLERLVPTGRVFEAFETADGRTWALAYEIPVGALPPAGVVDSVEANYGIDIRW